MGLRALLVRIRLTGPSCIRRRSRAESSRFSVSTLPGLPRHFLTGAELSPDELRALLDRGLELKADPGGASALAGPHGALVCEKPSTRTRVTCEVGVRELGGDAVVLRAEELQLSRGESPRDTALVLSRHVHAIGVRTGPDAILEALPGDSSVPGFNILRPRHHPR